MKSRIILFILATIFVAFLLTVACSGTPDSKADSERSAQDENSSTATIAKLPRMLDLGSVDCIPCKKMAPIIDSLKIVYQGKVEIEFIDIRQNTGFRQVDGIPEVMVGPNKIIIHRFLTLYKQT